MREEVHVARRKRRKFTAEFKAEVVALCRQGDRGIADVARDLGLTESSVRNWVRQADTDQGKGADGALTTQEKEEIRLLRREVRQLRMERDILKAATAFFAKEST
jgi:transposase